MYFGKGIEEPEKMMEILNDGKYADDVFFICTSKYGNNLMEIIHSKEIRKKIYVYKDYTVIGIAKDKVESFELVKEIILKYWSDGKLNSLKECLTLHADDNGGNMK